VRDGGRLAAALQVLADMEARHKPARLALKTWADGARYAGAKDRAFVSGLVLDVLRRRRSLAWRMDAESDRARILGALRLVWGWSVERIAAAAAEDHGPGGLTDPERARLGTPALLGDAPESVRGDYPDWLDPHLTRVFGENRVAEAEAMTARAPTDLRINGLKTDMTRALRALEPFGARALDRLQGAIRIEAPTASERAPAVETAPEFERGWFEVQDLGSQIAASIAGDIEGAQVLDFCAGGGGKTLAMGAAMRQTGQLYAYDFDARRLTDTVRRGQRAGLRNLQVRSPIHADALTGLEHRMDLVFVDAPCTGSGTWRRHPDAKWRLSAQQLARRVAEQDAVLAAAAAYVKPGGRLIYVTCSLFAEENEDRVATFIGNFGEFEVVEPHLRLTPAKDQTDGFFVAQLRRSA